MKIERLSIIGVGLLGGSIGMAARSAIRNCRIKGYDTDAEALARARQRRAIHSGASDLGHAVADADLVVLCTPVGAFSDVLRGMQGFLKRGALVTDVGSTKASIVKVASKILPGHARFVGSHPMVGSDQHGIRSARKRLLQNGLCITTPTSQTKPQALKAVESFWQTLGMRITRMSPGDHDRAMAHVSHLPHTVAAALVALQSPKDLEVVGNGFLDTTRIAGGYGGLWRDIFLDNADNMRRALAKLRKQLDEFEALLGPGRGDELRRWLDRAADLRRSRQPARMRTGVRATGRGAPPPTTTPRPAPSGRPA